MSADSLLSPKEARKLILRGKAPANLWVSGHLNLSNNPNLEKLPEGLTVASLDVSGCERLGSLPNNLRVGRLNLSGCKSLIALPSGLSCYEMEVRETEIRELPSDLRVEYRLDLSGCSRLERLPEGLKVGTLLLNDCVSLEALPEGLDVNFLDISGCAALRGWPRNGRIGIGRLRAANCARITSLPRWLTDVAQLDVSGCASLAELPEGLRVTSWLDLANSGIRSLPASIEGARLRWRGVPIDERIAFRPETITTAEILAETNAELRRVLLERMGYETFLNEAEAETLDRDRDPGGERRLLRVPMEGDEDLVCVSVICPSTGRRYVIRVPPTMGNCKQAVAWIAGFDDPKDYRPLVET
ncbi:MAG: DUF6745 domain-containing protein [Blastocatellia bacterium]